MRAAAFLILAATAIAQQTTRPPLVNLARLSIARVLTENHLDIYSGPRNAFDAGTHTENGFRYPDWTTGPSGYVIVRFAQPVTVSGVVVDAPEFKGDFAFQFRSGDGRVQGLRTVEGNYAAGNLHVPLQPVQDVREVLVTAAGQGKIEEIEILGPPPPGVNLSPVTPVAEEIPTPGYQQWEALNAQRSALNRVRAGMVIAQLRPLRAAVDRATGASARAQAWFELNQAADQVAVLLDHDESAKALLEPLEALGTPFYWCDPSGQWAAGTPGYENYLRLWPDGPRADDAWMAVSRFEGPRCGDFEGSLEEYEHLITLYSEFVRRFPSSRFTERMQKSLEQAQADYKVAYPSGRGWQLWGEALNALQSIEEWDATVTMKESRPGGRSIIQRSVGRGTNMRRSESGTGLAISDGKTLWTYDSAKREYTQGPASNGDVLFSGEGLSLFANAVAGLTKELEKLHDHLLVEEQDDRWIVDMRLSKDSPPNRWHFDKKLHLPLRIEEPNGTVEIVWRKVNEKVDDALFRFTPPAGAKLVVR